MAIKYHYYVHFSLSSSDKGLFFRVCSCGKTSKTKEELRKKVFHSDYVFFTTFEVYTFFKGLIDAYYED